ncbi:MAG: 3,4-dihydroxy-2-butanone-4-phosphate synthase, partial [Myroides sp.]
LVEILNEDGSMARLPQLVDVAKKFDMKLISIEDLVAYRMKHDSLIQKKEDFDIQTKYGTYRLRAYLQVTNKQVHIALTKGVWNNGDAVLTRINSSQVNNDILGNLTNNQDEKLDLMFQAIDREGKGAILFINQEYNTLDLLKRLGELKELQSETDAIVKAPKIQLDNKDFGIGAQILHDINISKIKLMSNSEHSKRVGMVGYGLEIVDHINF